MFIGHQKQKKYFQNLIKNGVLGHAYLFTGPEMTGKRTFALELAKTINGREPEKDPDFKLIAPKSPDGETQIHIKEIRVLKSFAALKPYFGPYKLIVLDNAHTMTTEAANALLKLLEEPPLFSVFILITSLPGLLLPTVYSRCEEVRFLPCSDNEVSAFLENKKISAEDKNFLTTLAGGRIGLISKLIEDKSLEKAKKAIEDLRQNLKGGLYHRMIYAKKIHEEENYAEIADYWLSWVSAHLKSDPKNRIIVKNLLALNQLLAQSQFNHRLALENFLLSL